MNFKLFLILLIFTAITKLSLNIETNLITNPKFIDGTCTLTNANPYCIRSSIAGWSAYMLYPIYTNTQFTIVNAKMINLSSPSENAIRLTNDNISIYLFDNLDDNPKN